MSEGNQYHCIVSMTRTGVRMTPRGHRSIIGSGRNWDAAYADLISKICEKLGDGEPKVSFSGLVPTIKQDRRFVNPRWTEAYQNGELMLWWNTSLLFSGGVCGLCGHPRGHRNRVPLVASGGSSGDYCNAWFIWDSTPRTHIMKNGFSPLLVSEQFLDRLTEDERRACDWLPVVMPKRSRKRYIECIPREFVSRVGHRRWEVDLLRCDECGHGEPRTSPTGNLDDFSTMRIDGWFSGSDVEAQARKPVFAVGDPGEVHLVWPIERALALVNGPHARGMTLFPLGALSETDVRRRCRGTRLSKVWKSQRADRPGSDGNPADGDGYADNPCFPKIGGVDAVRVRQNAKRERATVRYARPHSGHTTSTARPRRS